MAGNKIGTFTEKEMANFDFGHSNLLYQLQVVSSRLRRFPELMQRLEYEDSSIDKQKLYARLKKRKKELIKEIKEKWTGKMKNVPAGFNLPDPFYQRRSGDYWTSKPSRIDSVQEFMSERYPRTQTKPDKYEWSCPTYEGLIAPLAWRGRHYIEDIQHGSTYKGDYDDDLFEMTGGVIVDMSLNDDEDWWRNDIPDSFCMSVDIYWELPKTDCDVNVTCKIEVMHFFNFINSAETGGGYGSHVGIAHSDENGTFQNIQASMLFLMTGGASFSAEDDFNIIAKDTGNYGPRRSTIKITFEAKKDAITRIALGHMMQLWSQDGLVEVSGTVGTHFNASSTAGNDIKPLLSYVMTPL